MKKAIYLFGLLALAAAGGFSCNRAWGPQATKVSTSGTKPRYATVFFYSRTTGSYPNEIRTDTQLTAYKQTRQMRLQTDWVYGLRYNFGLTWFVRRNLFLEGRVHGGMNLTDAPSHRPPNLVRPFYIGFGVEAGVCF